MTVQVDDSAVDSSAAEDTAAGFTVELENFSGPFDALLGLISRRKLDITEVALAQVTDEFLDYVGALRDDARMELDELSDFLVVAATLLDLKTARLLPSAAGEDELDPELLEARDLLFARLLQYRAYKTMSRYFAARMTAAATRAARAVPLEERFHSLLPPLRITAGLGDLARLYAGAISRDTTPVTVALDHVHRPLVSVAEQRSWLLRTLCARGACRFSELTPDTAETLTVVARFLAVLELCKAGLCTVDQPEPLGPLALTPTPALLTGGPEAGEAAFALAGVEPADGIGTDGDGTAGDASDG